MQEACSTWLKLKGMVHTQEGTIEEEEERRDCQQNLGYERHRSILN